MSNEVNIDELRRLAKAATPGPWHTPDSRRLGGAISAMIDGRDCQVASVDGQAAMFDHRAEAATIALANAAFIAAANPATVLALLERVERAERELAGIREVSDPDNELNPESTLRDRMMHWCETAGCLSLANKAANSARAKNDQLRADLAEARMLCRDAQIQAEDRGNSYQAIAAQLATIQAERERDEAIKYRDSYFQSWKIAESNKLIAKQDGARDEAERVALWFDAEADRMDDAARHAPTDREAASCRANARELREYAAVIRAAAHRGGVK